MRVDPAAHDSADHIGGRPVPGWLLALATRQHELGTSRDAAITAILGDLLLRGILTRTEQVAAAVEAAFTAPPTSATVNADSWREDPPATSSGSEPIWPAWPEEPPPLKETTTLEPTDGYVGAVPRNGYVGWSAVGQQRPDDRDAGGAGEGEQDETEARMRALGIDAAPGAEFMCILPGHDAHPAHVTRTAAGYFRYSCEQLGTPLGMAEVRACRGYSCVVRPEGALAHAWRVRLDYEAGLHEPVPVDVDHPPGLSNSAIHFANGVALYVGLLYGPRWPHEFLLTRSFSSAWCDLSDEQAKTGRRAAEQNGVLIRVGTKPLPKGRATLFRVGPALHIGGRAA